MRRIPVFSTALLALEAALAHDRAGNAAEALRFYAAYLELSSRKAAATAERVRQRMEQLRGGTQ